MKKTSGSIFTTLLAGAALVGAISFMVYQTMSGPVATMARATNKATVDAQLNTDAKIIIGATGSSVGVTGAASNGGLIQLTLASSTPLATGTLVSVANVGGVPNATGTWTVTNNDATHITLQGSVMAGSYTSGGTVSAADCDADGFVEPPPWTVATPAPTNGGQLPTSAGLRMTDPWGTPYGYCVWDVGPYNSPPAPATQTDHGCGVSATEYRLSGSPTPMAGSTSTQTVIAVISAGPDRHFDTTCYNYSASLNDATHSTTDLVQTTAGKDDIVTRYTYAAASQISSLWTANTATTATIGKNLEVGDVSNFNAVPSTNLTSGGVPGTSPGLINAYAFTANGGIIKAGGGLQLPTQTAVTACAAGDVGTLRYNTSTTPAGVELCGGASPAWAALSGGGGSGITDLTDSVTNYATYHILGMGQNALCSYSTDGSCTATATGTNNTAIGISALAGVTSGSDNTATGYQAMQSITTGSRNTSFGYQSLKNLSTGSDNTAAGISALSSLTSAFSSSSIAMRGTPQLATRNGTGSVSVNVPAGTVAGDMLILFVDADDGPNDGTSMTLPANFTALQQGFLVGDGQMYVVAYKIADGTEGASLSVTAGSACCQVSLVLASYSGVANGTPISSASINTNANSSPYPVGGTVTVATAGTKVLWIAHYDNGGGTVTPPGGYTTEATDSGGTGFLADGTYTGVTTLSGSITDGGGTSQTAGIVVELQPAAAASSTLSNTAAGYQALSTNSTGTANTAAGYQALTANTHGSGNTAMGYMTLSANSVGNGNTAAGIGALTTTTGSGSTAAGNYALTALTTGTGNTAIGYSSPLGWTTTGSNNTAFGEALIGDTAGSNNTFVLGGGENYNDNADRSTSIGDSLYANTSGVNNTAVGNWEMAANTTGSNNTGIGEGVLGAETAASNNVAVGYGALTAHDINNNNTAIGYQALLNLSNSSSKANDNTAVGYQAMGVATPVREYNTAIGYQSMRGNVNGYYMTAVGYKSLAGTINNAANPLCLTAIGYEAMAVLNPVQIVDISTVVGYQALASTTVNSAWIVGIGSGALANAGTDTNSQNHVAVGYHAARNLSLMPNHLMGVGYNALAGTLASVTGQHTAFGSNALSAGGGGTENTLAIGSGAGTSNGKAAMSDEGSNVFVGYQAGHSVVSAQSLNTFGWKAGAAIEAGGGAGVIIGADAVSQGTVPGVLTLGYQALKNANPVFQRVTGAVTNGGLIKLTVASTANFPTGVKAYVEGVNGVPNANNNTWTITNNDATHVTLQGSTWGGSYTSGGIMALQQDNTAIGAGALTAMTTGTQNVAVGAGALGAVVTGSNNTALGYNVLASATGSSSGNTAAGYGALVNVVNGINNTAIGYNAGPGVYIPITSVTNNGSGKARLTVGSTAALGVTGNAIKIDVSGISGTPLANGRAQAATIMSGTTLDLTSIAYVAGGTGIIGYTEAPATIAVTGAANNGSGKVRLTVLSTSDLGAVNEVVTIDVAGIVGTTEANGLAQSATIISGTTLDLTAVSFVHAYTSGGTISYASHYTNTTCIGANSHVYGSNMIRVGDANVTTISGQTAFAATSDRRFKKDIKDSDLGLDFLMKLRPVSYRLINGDGRLDYGFIAQEMEQALDGRQTNMIMRQNDPDKTYLFRSADLLAPIVKTIQQQQTAAQKRQDDIDAMKADLLDIQKSLEDAP